MTDADSVAAMPPGERAVSFIAQNVWKRAAIVAAGPVANFLLAIVIFTGIFYVNGARHPLAHGGRRYRG